MSLSIRTAAASDLPAIERVMRASMAALGPGFYDAGQVASAVRYIAVADPQIVEDGTYYVVEDGGEIVACGGWSRRKKLFTGTAGQAAVEGWLDPATEPARIRAMFVHPGHARRGIGRLIVDRAEAEAREAGFTTCELMATLPGVPLYAACGYEPVEKTTIELPDGARLECVRMARGLK
jgi:GNAT superfamily N-acetyltransferase